MEIKGTEANFLHEGLNNFFVGGAFGGSTVEKDGTVVATQTVNPDQAKAIDKFYGKPEGVSVLHEVMEAYIGAKDNPGATSPTFDDVANNSPKAAAYVNAHNNANAIDPRHKDPNSLKDEQTRTIYITKFPYDERTQVINPQLPLFRY